MDKPPPIKNDKQMPKSIEIYLNTGNCRTCGLLFDRGNITPTCDAYFRCNDCRGINSIDCKSFFCNIQ